jgi:hypothetical protein
MNHLIIKRPDFRYAKDCLNALRKTELKYLVVQNFFDNEEIKSIIHDLRVLPKHLYSVTKPGFTVFPRHAFNISNRDEDMHVYFSVSNQAIKDLKENVTVDVVQRFDDVFKAVNNAQTVEILDGPGNSIKFIPVNFRLMTSEVGAKATSGIHNGSHVTARCINSTYQHLKGLIDFDNQLSFFSLLQNCNEGGDLTIYDFKVDDYPSLTDGRYLNNPGGSNVDLETTKEKCTVHMEPGDLIIFPGGQLWHRVEVVKKGERISLGGFVAARYSDNTWHYWN